MQTRVMRAVESAGIKKVGKIQIEDRPQKSHQCDSHPGYRLGGGMDDLQLQKCVGAYGEDTSGNVGRSILGMGLKDTIINFGKGTITSFKNGVKSACVLANAVDLTFYAPKATSAADRREFPNAGGGTTIEITVQNSRGDYSTGQHVKQIQNQPSALEGSRRATLTARSFCATLRPVVQTRFAIMPPRES